MQDFVKIECCETCKSEDVPGILEHKRHPTLAAQDVCQVCLDSDVLNSHVIDPDAKTLRTLAFCTNMILKKMEQNQAELMKRLAYLAAGI